MKELAAPITVRASFRFGRFAADHTRPDAFRRRSLSCHRDNRIRCFNRATAERSSGSSSPSQISPSISVIVFPSSGPARTPSSIRTDGEIGERTSDRPCRYADTAAPDRPVQSRVAASSAESETPLSMSATRDGRRVPPRLLRLPRSQTPAASAVRSVRRIPTDPGSRSEMLGSVASSPTPAQNTSPGWLVRSAAAGNVHRGSRDCGISNRRATLSAEAGSGSCKRSRHASPKRSAVNAAR